MDISTIKSLTIPEGNVTKIEDSQGRVLWSAIPDPNKYAYGIRWDHTVPESQATTACERIGNLELHKTLPIQSKFATCIHQGTDIKYWCDPNDSRFRKDNTGYRITNETVHLEKTTDAEKNAVPSDYSPSSIYTHTIQFPEAVLSKYEEVTLAVTTYKYLYAWIKINDVHIARVNKVNTTNKKLYITTDEDITGDITTIEFGCSINGYDGEISVYTPKFYIWSIDNDNSYKEVWISEKKCVDYAREVKAHLIGISRCPVLRTAMNDAKWGWLNTLSDNTSVSVVNYKPNLRGGTNNRSHDQYLGDNNFRTMLGKAASSISLENMRTYTQKIKGSQVLYYQIWSAIVWCYFIEYADFDVKKAFNSSLTSEGYHQGGLGNGLISIDFWIEYNNLTPNVPVDYTLSLGNNTNVLLKESSSFEFKSSNIRSWTLWNHTRVIATIISNTDNKVLNITSIPKLYTDWMLISKPYNIGGTHKYKIEGLTEGQTIIFKRQKGDLTVTTDGEYDVEWDSDYIDRCIIFGLVQESCNIKITILSVSSFTYTLTQGDLEVPCYRGFNTFWYGDTWLNLENLISQYDSTSKKKKFYFADNPDNFSNDINNEKNTISIDVLNGWARDIAVGTTANLITNRVANNKYINSYRADTSITGIYTSSVGGSSSMDTYCGLACLSYSMSIGNTNTNLAFAKCYIIN